MFITVGLSESGISLEHDNLPLRAEFRGLSYKLFSEDYSKDSKIPKYINDLFILYKKF